MVERLLLSLAITLLGVALLAALRRLHRRLVSDQPAATVASHRQPAILYFRSDHCGPCLAQSHHLRQLQRDLDGRLAIREIDAERERDLAARYGIVTLPTTLVIDGHGQVKHINYGLAASATLAHQLENVL
jgi:thiol-disulfide isomerase/thioredoxin